MLRQAIGITVIAVTVAGCSTIGRFVPEKTTFDGQRFRASSSSDRKDRENFVATVRQASKSLDGAVEAAEHEGIKHCIKFYGTSVIEWTVGPDTPREALQLDDDVLRFSGKCIE